MGKRKLPSQQNPEKTAWWSALAPLPKVCWVPVFAIALLLRTVDLGVKPAHFDEGVNGWFLDKMELSQVYNYDHRNYHGPLHFYLTLPTVAAFGDNEAAIRIVPVIFSLATLCLLFAFSTVLGRLPALLASAFFAISPGSVFYSRYGIHEAELCFFVTLFALSLFKLVSTGGGKWASLAIIAVAGGVLTKETFFINMATLPLAAACVWGLSKFIPQAAPFSGGFVFAPAKWTWALVGTVTVLSILVVEAFYGGFGTSAGFGLEEFAKSYSVWSGTADAGAGHKKESFDIWGGLFNYYWFALAARYEWPYLLGLLAAAFFWRRLSVEGQTLVTWSVGLLVAYSLIPYKTPWCMLSILPSMALASGVALAATTESLKENFHRVFWPLLAVVSPFSVTLVLNFKDYDSPGEPYVYVQTSREALEFMNELKMAELQDPRAVNIRGVVGLKSYFPLPWWLSRYDHLEYSGEDRIGPVSGRYWVLVPARKSSEFLEKNSERRWRSFNFKLRDGQEEVAAFFDASVYPETGVFVHPTDRLHTRQAPPPANF